MGLETMFVTLALLIHGVRSHGRLMEPPSRSSMWRSGFDVPKNYNDNGLNCGGMQYQWVRNGGRCGLCGDPVDGPRPNEAGGIYATGTISRLYDSGQKINISVEITSAHRGWFEFRLCPNNEPSRRITSECLNEHLLEKADGTSRHEGVPGGATEGAGFIYMQYILPANMTCSQCVLQWKYHTAKDWGCDSTGCGSGKGIQEEFYGCSDIAIRATSGQLPDTTTTSTATTTTTTAITSLRTTAKVRSTVSSTKSSRAASSSQGTTETSAIKTQPPSRSTSKQNKATTTARETKSTRQPARITPANEVTTPKIASSGPTTRTSREPQASQTRSTKRVENSSPGMTATTGTKSPQGGTTALDNDITSCHGRGVLRSTSMDRRCRQLCQLSQCLLAFCNDACHRLAPTN